MSAQPEDYRAVIASQEERILGFLRAFEALQERIHLGKIRAHKEEIYGQLGDLFPPLNSQLEGLQAPEDLEGFDKKWRHAVEHLEDAYTSFLTGSEANFLVAYMQSRHAFTQGKYLLYALRADLPVLRSYWFLSDVVDDWEHLERPPEGLEVRTGVMHRPGSNAHGEYSLYVPENTIRVGAGRC